jgi:hypothetical protein
VCRILGSAGHQGLNAAPLTGQRIKIIKEPLQKFYGPSALCVVLLKELLLPESTLFSMRTSFSVNSCMERRRVHVFGTR